MIFIKLNKSMQQFPTSQLMGTKVLSQNQTLEMTQYSQDQQYYYNKKLFDLHVKLEVKLILMIHQGQKNAKVVFNNLKQIHIDEERLMNIIEFRLGQSKEISFKNYQEEQQLIIFHQLCEKLQIYIKSNKFQIIEEFLSKIEIDYKLHTFELIRQVIDDPAIIPLQNQLNDQLNQYEQQSCKDNSIFGFVQRCQNLFKNCFTNKESFKVLILGRVGTGKSTLGNELVRELSQNQIQGHFNSSDSYFGGTKSFETTQITFQNIFIDIIDSPGFGDVEVDIIEMIQNLYSIGTINVIIYCFNATVLRQQRLDSYIFAFVQGLYQQKWENFYVCLNFTDYLKPADLNDSQKFDGIIKLLNESFKSTIPPGNLIKTDKIQKIIDIILTKFRQSGYYDGFIRYKYIMFSKIYKKAKECLY